MVLNEHLNILPFGGTFDLSGVISGSSGFTKSQTGTLRLSGAGSNSYDGPTTVNMGILE